VKSIVTYDGELESARAPQSITLCLEDEIDVSRGDMLVHSSRLPHVSRHFEAMCVWMSAEPLRTGASFLLKHTTQQVRATVTLLHRVDVNTLERAPAEELGLNDIGAVAVETSNPLFFDGYRRNRATGAFILIDPASNATAAAGVIVDARRRDSGGIAVRAVEHGSPKVTPAERLARLGHGPATVWLTARLELASVLERKLFDRGCLVQVLADRAESGIVPELAEVLHAAGAIVVCSVAGETAEECERARRYAGEERFIEFDPESLPPGDEDAADRIMAALEARGIIRPAEAFWSGEGI
jgi:hypothetical protein